MGVFEGVTFEKSKGVQISERADSVELEVSETGVLRGNEEVLSL